MGKIRRYGQLIRWFLDAHTPGAGQTVLPHCCASGAPPQTFCATIDKPSTFQMDKGNYLRQSRHRLKLLLLIIFLLSYIEEDGH
jgi:hypothetical protein